MTTRVPHVTITTRVQHFTMTTRVQHFTMTTRVQHFTMTTRVQHVTMTTRIPHVTKTTRVPHVTMTTRVQHVTMTTRVQHVTMTTYTCHKRCIFILFKPELSYYTAKGHEQNPQVVLERKREVSQGSDCYLTFHIILDYHHPANRCRNQHNTDILSANLSYKIYVQLAYFITKFRGD